MTFEDFIRSGVATKHEIDVFLNELSWAKFDSEVGYILGNYIPHDGITGSSTLSTVQENGARRSFSYSEKPCRINAYGDSFTQCHQVSDSETWEEYLAGHLGEPVRNFGMGGYGVNQTYRRMLMEEKTPQNAGYLLFYIWGDDHIRSLLRCRYILIRSWMKDQGAREGVGKMFHGNFWPNVEMNFKTGELEEHPSRIRAARGLYQMTDPAWMFDNLKDDFALQMALFKDGQISDIDVSKLHKLASFLHSSFGETKQGDTATLQNAVAKLLDTYSFAATKLLLKHVKEFAQTNHKKVMLILFDPYRVTKALMKGEKRYDQEIVDFLESESTTYFDMNLDHLQDYKSFTISIDDYFKRYFIGHYSPAGNHFFAYSIAPKIVQWLEPKPITYRSTNSQKIDFKGYLEGY